MLTLQGADDPTLLCARTHPGALFVSPRALVASVMASTATTVVVHEGGFCPPDNPAAAAAVSKYPNSCAPRLSTRAMLFERQGTSRA